MPECEVTSPVRAISRCRPEPYSGPWAAASARLLPFACAWSGVALRSSTERKERRKMSEHHAGVRWRRTSETFTYETYNRAHEMVFKSGAIRLPASSAPAFRGDADRVDPEEAYVASLASCHMLTLLAI